MKLSRIYQPRNPIFWLIVVLNLLSTMLAWIGRNYDLTPLAASIVAVMAAGNAGLGIFLMLRLIRDQPAKTDDH